MWMSRCMLMAGCLALPSALAAQQADRPIDREPPPRTERPEQADPARGPATQNAVCKPVEDFFVRCLTQANQAEVALSKIAQQRASNKEVQAFAEQLAQDHTKMLGQLQQISGRSSTRGALEGAAPPDRGDSPATRPGAQDRPAADRPATARPAPGGAGQARGEIPERGAAPARPTTGSSDLASVAKIAEEVGKLCLASAMEELETKKGEEFDKCFVGMQIAAHQKMADELAVLKNHVGSPELRQLLTQGHETTTNHLSHAKNLMKTLDQGGTATARKPATPERE
ncbi:MAG: hypothetical protein DCC68_26705 [Planctomycetota bacterium]|nr:MAG: hypothetical protein DCC68_26705 [Planctomycetota bacterium]